MTVERQVAIHDSLYGRVIVNSPVILDLIESKPIKRLKGINQYGIPDRFFYRQNYSRYEHSVGVMLLLRSLGASEEEQSAGLIHDVSHRAFSHIYDWMVGRAILEDTQDNNHAEFVLSSEIPKILTNHGYDAGRLVDYHNFGLLERDIPDLCADRIDYTLRQISIETAKKILAGLTVFNNHIVAVNYTTASIFAREFLFLQVVHWGGKESAGRYYHFSNVLKLALQLGVITEEDFLEHDEHVISKLESSGNEEILASLRFLEQEQLPPSSDTAHIVRGKFRYVDPLFLREGNLTRLSDADEEFGTLLKEAKDSNLKGSLV